MTCRYRNTNTNLCTMRVTFNWMILKSCIIPEKRRTQGVRRNRKREEEKERAAREKKYPAKGYWELFLQNMVWKCTLEFCHYHWFFFFISFRCSCTLWSASYIFARLFGTGQRPVRQLPMDQHRTSENGNRKCAHTHTQTVRSHAGHPCHLLVVRVPYV